MKSYEASEGLIPPFLLESILPDPEVFVASLV
jgi:hypothetical protein